MALIFQTVGVLAVSVLAARILPLHRGPRAYIAACLLVSSVLLLVPFAGHLLYNARTAVAGHTKWAGLTQQQADAQVGAQFAIPTEFVEWARNRMRAGDSYYFLSGPPEVGANNFFPYHNHWITYRMLPYLALDSPEKADVIVFYGMSPRKWRPPAGRELVVEPFTPLYAVGRW